MKKIIKPSYLLLGIAVFFVIFASKTNTIFADGMAIHPTSNRVFDYTNERSQQAFINYGSGVEKMILSVDLDTTSNEGDTLWIFPVPAKPEDISIDVIKELPHLNGEEISSKAKSRITEIQNKLWQTQIYPYFFMQPRYQTSRYSGSDGKGLAAGFLSSGSSSNSQNVIVYDTIQKEGITSELATAQTAGGLYDHLKEKGLNMEKGSIPILDEYIEKDFSFILSWISNKKELPQNQEEIGATNMIYPENTPPNFVPTDDLTVDIKQMRLEAIEKIINEYPKRFQSYKQLDPILNDFENKHPDLKKLEEDNQLIRRSTDQILQIPEMTGVISNLEKKYPQLKNNIDAGFPNDVNYLTNTQDLYYDMVREIRNNSKVLEAIKKKDQRQHQYVGGPPPFRPGLSGPENAQALGLYLAENPSLKKDLINDIDNSPISDSLALPVAINPSLPPLPPTPSDLYPTPNYQRPPGNNFPNYSNPSQERGVSITFPTNKIFFPLKLTSVYGDKVIPIDVRIIGYVKPDLPDNIKNSSNITYYTNNNIGYTAETKNFFGENIPSNYTKININGQAKYLQEDLQISSFPPLKAYFTLFIARYPAILTILLLIISSLIAGFFASVFTLKDWITKSSVYKIIILSLSNCLTIIGVIVTVLIYSHLNKKQGRESEKQIDASKNMLLVVYVPLFSIFFLIISLFVVKMLGYFLLGDASDVQNDSNIFTLLEHFFQQIFSFSD